RMRMRSFVIVALVALVGAACGKDKAPTAPKSPSSTEAREALWKLAPEGAKGGIVVTPAGLTALERGWLAIKKLYATTPGLASIAAEMDAQLTEKFGSPDVTLADVGMAPDKGFAVFFAGDDSQLMIVPV